MTALAPALLNPRRIALVGGRAFEQEDAEDAGHQRDGDVGRNRLGKP